MSVPIVAVQEIDGELMMVVPQIILDRLDIKDQEEFYVSVLNRGMLFRPVHEKVEKVVNNDDEQI